MPNRSNLRECPERAQGRAPLFAHQISLPVCAARQGALYHKCYSCVHFQGQASPAAVIQPLAPPRETERRAPEKLPLPVAPKPALAPARLKVG